MGPGPAVAGLSPRTPEGVAATDSSCLVSDGCWVSGWGLYGCVILSILCEASKHDQRVMERGTLPVVMDLAAGA